MKYQNSLKDRTQCTICPRMCVLKDGQRGFCHVRQNTGGNIELTSFGYTTGLSIDPIEKKPLYHFYPQSKVLSFGTIGCNLDCQFCQNWQTSKSTIDPKRLKQAAPADIARLAQKYACKSVAFTYNEPTVFFEYAIETAKECKKLGIKTVAVSNGYINPEPRKEFFNLLDAVNIDLKAFTRDFYKKNCLAGLAPVLDTIKYVANETDTFLELTTLLIEGENDSAKEIEQECKWIVENIGTEIPLHFSAFHPAYKFMETPPTQISTLLKAVEIAKLNGIKYVYSGNVLDTTSSTTYCKNCGAQLIVRNGYALTEYNLNNNGQCPQCKTICDGHF